MFKELSWRLSVFCLVFKELICAWYLCTNNSKNNLCLVFKEFKELLQKKSLVMIDKREDLKFAKAILQSTLDLVKFLGSRVYFTKLKNFTISRFTKMQNQLIMLHKTGISLLLRILPNIIHSF